MFLCNTASRMVDELTVLVCSTDLEPIPGKLRYAWMREALPHINIAHMHRNIPQEPDDDPDFWNIWRRVIHEFHPAPIDTVFGSEPYVSRLAKELDATPLLIDPERVIFPISGSAIRENPAKYWNDLVVTARPYFQKRLCLLGPESTGKSRLADTLAAHFGTLAMPEYGRRYDIDHMQGEDGNAKGQNWTEADLVLLANTHIAMREAMIPEAGALLIEDTDIIQTAIWAEFLLSARSPALETMIASAALADHYLVLSADVQWIDDGVRYAGDDNVRRWFFDDAIARLQKLGLSYDIIEGTDWAVRTARAIDVAERIFAGFGFKQPS
jgi:HTH-type transcriptional regulator, transcriptional repressor of NAD biosynthesis genes